MSTTRAALVLCVVSNCSIPSFTTKRLCVAFAQIEPARNGLRGRADPLNVCDFSFPRVVEADRGRRRHVLMSRRACDALFHTVTPATTSTMIVAKIAIIIGVLGPKDRDEHSQRQRDEEKGGNLVMSTEAYPSAAGAMIASPRGTHALFMRSQAAPNATATAARTTARAPTSVTAVPASSEPIQGLRRSASPGGLVDPTGDPRSKDVKDASEGRGGGAQGRSVASPEGDRPRLP